ncbi:unnamed protein product [Strongylus vulgaris]|uniref:EF-hand domain-containing protein n=1 Tax=Strongylus vulgaris TaxID=40348 RepID=A0A3P7LLJ2_STRVU|nr:unnamed protein product [Strongylus vulgaris]
MDGFLCELSDKLETKPKLRNHELREMFRNHDKDMSGFISKDDVLCMLLGADKDDRKDPVFKTHLKFLINIIKEADKDGDMKISKIIDSNFLTKI